jgi:hypothetical protein
LRFLLYTEIVDEDIYQVEVSDTFKPYRRHATFEDCKEVPIRPLIEQLTFIRNKKSWGYMFRFGLFEINEDDFRLIYSRMKGTD